VKELRPALCVFIALSLITGIVYPLAVTCIAQAIFPAQANGSVIMRGGVKVGSSLIGQEFSAGEPKDTARSFWGRPSATGPVPYSSFNPDKLTGSSGSNLGPTNPALIANIQSRLDALKAADTTAGYKRPQGQLVPVDLVTASGSGLDPHISLAAARYQLPRVAKALNTPESELNTLMEQCTISRQLGVLGEPTVNVLDLNLRLQAADQAVKR
jgi:K+-transporting ATPase ATPase C chain